MKKLPSILYVILEGSYLSLDGENIVVLDKKREVGRLPLHNLEGIVSLGYRGTGPALMGTCANRNVSLCFVNPGGRFLVRVAGSVKGDIVLGDKQCRTSVDEDSNLGIAENCMTGKVYSARWVLERSIRDHSIQTNVEKVRHASLLLKDTTLRIRDYESKDSLRGFKSKATSVYFGVFDELILQQKKDFAFSGRNRKPPTDNINAMLSFVYTLLTNHIISALETIGLSPYVRVLHTRRPGRVSPALDLIEKLRPVLTDHFVLSMVNKKIVQKKDFLKEGNRAVLIKDNARERFPTEWQNRKKGMPTHPYLQEKMGWGMVPCVQAMLLAKYLRGDSDAYPPFLWEWGQSLLVLITCDVNTETAGGEARLRKVAKQCVDYRRRVRNSVFECILDNAQCVMLKSLLAETIDEEADSLRFYYLGSKYKTRVEHVGVNKEVTADETLFL